MTMAIAEAKSLTLEIRAEGLDLIFATFLDRGPGAGLLTVSCAGQAWSHYWGGMGKDRLLEFVAHTSDGYLGMKLAMGARTLKRLTKKEEAYIDLIAKAVREAAGAYLESQKVRLPERHVVENALQASLQAFVGMRMTPRLREAIQKTCQKTFSTLAGEKALEHIDVEVRRGESDPRILDVTFHAKTEFGNQLLKESGL